MITYSVRSRQIIDLVNEMKNGKLISAPFFQRKLVWRNIHKIDFIKTIIAGYPFPEIFISSGDINIEEMSTTSCVVDGQQRLSSIRDYIDNKFEVDGRVYKDLDIDSKERFLRYEVAVIELDSHYDNPEIIEIFRRLNRTFYSLTAIERLSSEFGSSEFMLVAKLLSRELEMQKKDVYNDDGINNDATDDDELDKDFQIDPGITKEFIKWAKGMKVNKVNQLIVASGVFSPYEISRQVHLNFVLNLLGFAECRFFNRNLDKEVIERYTEDYPNKTLVVNRIEAIADYILKVKLKKGSFFFGKSNMFTLITLFYENYDKMNLITSTTMKDKLEKFEVAASEAYRLAAREGVNNKKERMLRNNELNDFIFGNMSDHI